MTVAHHRTSSGIRLPWGYFKPPREAEPYQMHICEGEGWPFELQPKPTKEYEEYAYVYFTLLEALILKYYQQEWLGQAERRLADRHRHHGRERAANLFSFYATLPEPIRAEPRAGNARAAAILDKRHQDRIYGTLVSTRVGVAPQLRLGHGFTVLAYCAIAFLTAVLALGWLPLAGAFLVIASLVSMLALFYWFWAANRISIIHPAVCIFGLITSATWLLTILAKLIIS